MTVEATICLIRSDGRLLLQEKAHDRFGGGKWDAPGGKLGGDESPEECVVREVEEETGLRILNPTLRGRFSVYFGSKDDPDWLVHVFSASRFEGAARSSLEGQLHWFPEHRLPYERMWPSDRCWLPDLLEGRLAGRPFEATFWFDEKAERLLDYSLRLD